MRELLEYLRSLGEGPVYDTTTLARLLTKHWYEFSGGDSKGMKGYKLIGRMEDVHWKSPILSFSIERHGTTVCGSTRAGVYRWELNLSTNIATCEWLKRRQVKPMQKPLDVRPLAQEISDLIIARRLSPHLKWNDDGTVRVLIGKILPEGSAVQQTLTSRRKRFRSALKDFIAAEGWCEVRPNIYSPHAS